MHSLLGYHQSQEQVHFWDSLGVWDSIAALSKHRGMPNTKLSFFQIPTGGGIQFRIHHLRDKFATPPHFSNHHQNVILEFLDFHLYPGNQLKLKIISWPISYNISN